MRRTKLTEGLLVSVEQVVVRHDLWREFIIATSQTEAIMMKCKNWAKLYRFSSKKTQIFASVR